MNIPAIKQVDKMSENFEKINKILKLMIKKIKLD